MSFVDVAGGITKLSQLIIDADKAWPITYSTSHTPPWYSPNYGNRKVITVAGSATVGAQTNIVALLKISSASGVDTGFNVFLDGKVRADFFDVVFTKADGTTLLKHFIWSVSGTTAVILVQLDAVPAGGATFYLYYNYPLATDTSDSSLFTIYESMLVDPTHPQTISVAASVDDSSQLDPSEAYSNTAPDEFMGKGIDGNPVSAAMIFRGINIPAGQRITSAYITFIADANKSDTPNLTIVGENNAAPPTYGASENFTLRTPTVASVAWVPGNWNTDVAYNTPDISAIIQELVNSFGPYSSGEIAIQVRGYSGTAAWDVKKAYSYDGDPTKVPVLHITYGGVLGGVAAYDGVNHWVLLNNNTSQDGSLVYNFTTVEEVAVTAAADDSSGTGSSFSNASPNQFPGGNFGGDPCSSAFLFRGLNIPANAIITKAYIKFNAEYTRGGQTVTATIKGQASLSPSAYGATEDYTARSYLGTTVAYSPEANWNAGTLYNSADISAIVQALLAAYGPYVNGVMAFEIIDNGSGANNFQVAQSYDNGASLAAILHIEYMTDPVSYGIIYQQKMSGGADSEFAFGESSDSFPDSNDNTTTGFNFVTGQYSGGYTKVFSNGSNLASGALGSLNDGNFHSMLGLVNKNNANPANRDYLFAADGTTILSGTTSTVPTPASEFGWNARSGGIAGTHILGTCGIFVYGTFSVSSWGAEENYLIVIAYGITNLKELAAGMVKGDGLYYDGAILQKISPGLIGEVLTTHDFGNDPTWSYPP